MRRLYITCLVAELALVDDTREHYRSLLQTKNQPGVLEYHVAQKLCGVWKRGPMSRFSKYK